MEHENYSVLTVSKTGSVNNHNQLISYNDEVDESKLKRIA